MDNIFPHPDQQKKILLSLFAHRYLPTAMQLRCFLSTRCG